MRVSLTYNNCNYSYLISHNETIYDVAKYSLLFAKLDIKDECVRFSKNHILIFNTLNIYHELSKYFYDISIETDGYIIRFNKLKERELKIRRIIE